MPSETSPLLSSINPVETAPVSSGLMPEEANNPGLEHHDSVDESRTAQFAGRPEIQKNLKYILPAVGIGVFLSAADQTIIVTSYAKIGSELNALSLTSWIATSYFLALTSFQVLYGKLSDIFGRKTCLLFAYAIFGIGCLFCAVAQDMNQLIAARIFQGIGGGGMTTVVSIIISDIVPLKDRGLWQGFLNTIYATGSAVGAPVGGILCDTVGWRFSFLGQFPLCIAAFVAVVFALKLPKKEQRDWRTNLRRIDFFGAAALVAAVFALIFGLDRGSNAAWSLPISYGPLIASIFIFSGFVYIEMRVAKEPIAPGHVVFERSMLACYLCNFFSFGGWLSALFYIPLFFQVVDGVNATSAGIRLIPAIFAGVSGSLFGGYMMRRTGRYYWLTVSAYSLLTLGAVVFTLSSGILVHNIYAISLGMVMCSFGNGIGVTSTLVGLIANAGPEDQAIATACSYLFRSLGSVIGLSLSTTVINQALRKNLQSTLGSGKEADKIVKNVRQSLDFIKSLPPEVGLLVRECYGSATRYGYCLTILIVFGAALSALFIKEKRLSR